MKKQGNIYLIGFMGVGKDNRLKIFEGTDRMGGSRYR